MKPPELDPNSEMSSPIHSPTQDTTTLETPPQNIARKKQVHCRIVVTRLAVWLLMFTVNAAVKRIRQRISPEALVYGDNCACQIHPTVEIKSPRRCARQAPIKKRDQIARLLLAWP
jgi:hypothetical protein